MSYPLNRRLQAGVSLIELLVSLALIGIVLIPAAALLLQAFTNETAYRQQNNAQQNARHALDLVADDMKGAKRVATVVTVDVGGKTVKATLPTNTVLGANSATASITDAAPLYFNIFDDNGTERRVRYWLEGKNLRRDIVTYGDETTTPGIPASAVSGSIVARNVLTFTAQKPHVTANDLNPGHYSIVRLVVTSGESAGNQQSSVTVSADVTLRNNLL